MRDFEATWFEGSLTFGRRFDEFKQFAEANPRMRYWVVPQLPESRKQRGYYHGAVLTLWAYLDEKNYRSSAVLSDYHKIVQMEFAGHTEVTNNKVYTVPGSTKGKLDDIIEKLIDMLEEQYGVDRQQCLDPEHFKDFRDRIYPTGEFDTYIDYLLHQNRIKKP